MQRSPYEIIVRPHITEKTVALSYGKEFVDDKANVRKYTFVVAKDANKLEIAAALEAIYNSGKGKKDALIEVTDVQTVGVRGKMRRVGRGRPGQRPSWKKAVITLAAGQQLEDYGV
ncbi:MAG: 50S ribosomal protein L23 [Chthonomonas sp.]|nr:50S ribosomal protein L23 [Chthonomonas sp.]